MTAFDFVAFGAMAVVFCAGIFLVIWLGDMPGNIAKKRNHPQVTAVQALSWFGLLFTGGIGWIVAMVWAFYDYSASAETSAIAVLTAEIGSLHERLEKLESNQTQTGGTS